MSRRQLWRSLIFHNQKRCFYEQTKSGSVEFERKKRAMIPERERLRKAIQSARKDFKWSWQTFKDSTFNQFKSDYGVVPFDDMQLIKVWDFDQRNTGKISSFVLDYKENKLDDLKNWNVTCDADFDLGFSRAAWCVSPAGYGMFCGHLDKTLPKDGRVVRTGYAYLSSIPSHAPFGLTDEHHLFEEFTHLVMHVRGDGRRYFVTFDTSGVLDISWFDRYQFPMFTWGGPYWQYVKIPLNRFFFHYQGYIQDEQYEFSPREIKSIGILAYDTFSGPFRLEIDYIGFIKDTQHNDRNEYEGYFHESTKLKSG